MFHNRQRRFQGRFWKTSSISIGHYLLAFLFSMNRSSLPTVSILNFHLVFVWLQPPFCPQQLKSQQQSPWAKSSGFFSPWATITFSGQFSTSLTLFLLWFLDLHSLVSRPVILSPFLGSSYLPLHRLQMLVFPRVQSWALLSFCSLWFSWMIST